MIKKMLSDRKGVAIELAILMTAVCLAVTTIVLSTALLQYENKVQAQQRMEESIVLEQIVEKFTTLTEKTILQIGLKKIIQNIRQHILIRCLLCRETASLC